MRQFDQAALDAIRKAASKDQADRAGLRARESELIVIVGRALQAGLKGQIPEELQKQAVAAIAELSVCLVRYQAEERNAYLASMGQTQETMAQIFKYINKKI